NSSIGTVNPGELRQFTLLVYPSTNVAPGNYPFTLAISGGTTALQGAVNVTVTQLTIGNASFVVSDDTGSKVTGGTVTLIGQTNGKTYQAATASDGTALLSGVDGGTYNYVITAPSHKPSTGSVTVAPNATVSNSVVIVYDVVSLTFTVTPTTIQDVYHVTLNVTY